MFRRGGQSPSGIVTGSKDSRESFWNRLLFATVLFFTFLSTCYPMFDTDFWWHLRTGQWILENQTIPGIDLYTFVDYDKPWIDLHWGFQVLVAILYGIGGVPLVSLAKSAIITGAVAVGWKASGTALPAWNKSIVWVLPIVCISGRANERPEILTLLFLACWLWVARHTDERPKWIWILPLLQLVWVNCHALFILGLIVGFCYAVDSVVRELLGGRFGLEPRTGGPEFRTIWIVGGLVAVSCFLNPYFEEGAFFPLVLYRKFSTEKEFYSVNIGEFRPPINFVLQHGLNNVYLLAELESWVVAAVSFVVLLVARGRWSPFRALIFAAFSHLAWQASRNTNIFALTAAFVACENFNDLYRRPALEAPPPLISARILRTKGMIGFFIAFSVLIVTGLWNEVCEKNKPFRLGEAPNWFIHDAARFAGQPGFPDWAFVANNGQAEVYIYHNGPERKVFMDARLEVCTQHTFELYNNMLKQMEHGETGWMSVFRDQTMPVVILDSRSSRAAINGLLSTRGWRLVFADRSAAVFLQVETADRLDLPTADPTPLKYPDGPPKSERTN